MFQLKISIDGFERPIWRRVLVPRGWTLHHLHHVIQRIFNWEDYHLHSFWMGKREFGVPDPETQAMDESRVRLDDVLRARSKLRYEYDFGDSWEHTIVVEKVVDGEEGRARCLAGPRAGPPEDSGGPWGYTEKLAILADPDNDDHEEIREWLGDDFDAEAFDLDDINRCLWALHPPQPKKSRSGGPARTKKSARSVERSMRD
jgi:hypothetical protein